MPDLPDYYIQAELIYTDIKSFFGGLDANKSATPVSRDIYYATDTKILYVCVIDGTWINLNALYLLLAGGTMSGNIAMGTNKITGQGAPGTAGDGLRYGNAEIRNAEIAVAAAILESKLALNFATHARYLDTEAVAAVEAAGLTLAAAKKIIYANDGLAQFGVLDGSPTVRGGRAGFPYMLIVQPKDGNNVGELCVMPKGSEDAAYYCLYNAASLTDYGYMDLAIDGTQIYLLGDKVGGGTAPTRFRIRFDTCPHTSTLDYGLGDATYWWKHVKAKGHHILSGLPDHSWSGIVTVDITAGENLVFGDAVYMKSDGKAWKSDADAATTLPIFGIAIATINAEATGEILTQGWIRDDTWSLTAGGIVYASVTPGAISTTAPVGSGDQVQVVGIAKTTTLIHLNPSYELVEIS